MFHGTSVDAAILTEKSDVFALLSALVLIKYLENVSEFPYPDFWKGKSIIDIGSGTGVVGIACALLTSGIPGVHVTLTDQAPLLDLLRQNAFKLNNVSASRLAVKELNWGTPLVEAPETPVPPFDLLLLSDVVTKAYKAHFPALIKTIQDMSSPKSRIILCYELRDPEDQEFFALLRKSGLSYSKVPDSKLDPDYTSDDIGIFEIRHQPADTPSANVEDV